LSEVSRLFSLAAFLAAHDGISLRAAAAATHRTPQALLADIDRLMMCGVPPYSPSDYLQISVSGSTERARVHVRFASHFARPLNFAPQEAVALKYALEHFRRGSEPAAQHQLDALLQSLGAVTPPAGRGFVTPRQTARMRAMMAQLSQAAEDQQLVAIEYYSAHRASIATRTVHPFAVIEIGPHFYLYAFCNLADDTRHFRLDRIRRIELRDIFFDEQPPRIRRAGRMDSLFDGSAPEKLVVRFSRHVAREVADEWQDAHDVKVKTHADGRATATMRLYNQFWAIGFVTGFGEHAELLEPKWLRAELARTLRKSLKAHTGRR